MSDKDNEYQVISVWGEAQNVLCIVDSHVTNKEMTPILMKEIERWGSLEMEYVELKFEDVEGTELGKKYARIVYCGNELDTDGFVIEFTKLIDPFDL